MHLVGAGRYSRRFFFGYSGLAPTVDPWEVMLLCACNAASTGRVRPLRSLFPGGIGFDPGATGVTATITVPSAPRICPKCGGPAHILGGAYRIAEDTIELLQGPQRTVSELERLREIFRVAKQSGASVEDVKGTVEREFPGWGRTLAAKLVPKRPRQ